MFVGITEPQPTLSCFKQQKYSFSVYSESPTSSSRVTSFTCRPRAAWGAFTVPSFDGAACVCWAWVPPLEDDACHDEHLHAPVLCGAHHILRHVLRHVLYVL